MCNSTGYRKFVLELKDEILEKDSISKEEASEYIESLDHFNKELNEEDRLGLSNQIDLMKLYINLIVKIKNSNLEIKSELENQKKELESNKTFIEDYNKRILEMMGIFLSIFSVIGLGISSILNIENNHFAIWSMICGVILITMSGLFYLINFNEKIGEKFLKVFFPMFCGLILIGIGAFAKHSFPEKNNTMIELSREIEKLKTERIK